LPENEHLTMQLAKLVGIETPPNGLFPLKDRSVAYLVRRFDRVADGQKLLQEDFCQLAGKSPKEKYDASYELCGKLVLRYASEPRVDARSLFRQVAFSYWVGNGDLHLKNLSLLRGQDGLYRLSPAYDLLATMLVIPDDQLALTIQGNRKNVTRKRWMKLAEACQLPEKAASRVLREIAAAVPEALDLIGRTSLPDEQKATYTDLVRGRGAELSTAVPEA
jgi:serine/threonine-protein kinase HipA